MSMTITLDLPPDVEASIRERATARGLEFADYVRALLQRDAAGDDPDADLSEEERAAVREGVQRGLADFAAGRYRPFSEFAAEMRARYALSD